MCRGVPVVAMKPKHAPARELVLHDTVNLIALPILTLGSLAGLLGLVDAYWVTLVFMAYVAFDFVWLWLCPKAVPSLANVILAHHVVTFVLLTFPLRHRQFGNFTCWDGLTELNTWLLVLRRQWGRHRQLLNSLYWITFIPQRLILYPALLLKFWFVLEGFPLPERLLVCTCQLLLCCFNFGVFSLSVARRRAGEMPPHLAPTKAVKHADAPASDDAQIIKPARPNNITIRAHGGVS